MKMRTEKPFYEMMPKSPSNWLFGELKNQFVGKVVPVQDFNNVQLGEATILDDMSLEIVFDDSKVSSGKIKTLLFNGKIKENDVGGYDVEVYSFKVLLEQPVKEEEVKSENVEVRAEVKEDDIYEKLLNLGAKVVFKYTKDGADVKLAAEMMAEFCKELLKNFKIEERGE